MSEEENRSNMNEFPSKVIDEAGREYHLQRKIGEGGQGAVFLAKEKGLAIKLVRVTPGGKFEFADHDKIEQAKESFKKIKNIPLEDISIKAPIAVLDFPYIGYVMEILDDMIPLTDLMFEESDVLIPASEEKFKLYVESGGLKRRVKVLARIAETISQLHGKGLVFADPSPNNFFITTDMDDDEISLIDADNLEYESKLEGRTVFTPPYGAPELVKGVSGVNTLTDAHAFAVMAFWLLSGVHPRYGDLVSDGPPEMEEKAQAGEVPWIDDEDDNSNSTDNGIPREIVLTPKIQALCQKTFEIDVVDRIDRPRMIEWENALNEALMSLVPCKCGFHYYNTMDACPLCNQPKPNIVMINLKSWLPKNGEIDFYGGFSTPERNIHTIVLTEREPVILNNRLITGVQGEFAYDAKLELQYNLKKNEIIIQNQDRTNDYYLSDVLMENIEKIQRKVIVDLSQDVIPILHFGSPNEYHRAALFSIERR